MELAIGSVVEGRVTGITKYGAFVALEGGKSGLVHISEVANAFVSDVSEHVQVGQTVKVRVLSISPEGKINLSIKKAAEQPSPERDRSFSRPAAPARRSAPSRPAPAPASAPPAMMAEEPVSADQDFEDRLKKFMKESDSRIADNRFYADHNRRTRRR